MLIAVNFNVCCHVFIIFQLDKKPSFEMKPKDRKDTRKEFDKLKKSHSIVKAKYASSPKLQSKKSKLAFMASESPKLKGVAGYLWKVIK